MLKSWLEPRIDEKFREVILKSNLRVEPNKLTLLSLPFAALGFGCLVLHWALGAVICYFLSFLLDFLDGCFARALNKQTKLGSFLDGISDRWVEVSLYLGLYFYVLPHGDLWGAVVLLLGLGALMTSYVKAYAHHRGLLKQEELSRLNGFVERGERALLILSALLLALIDERLLLILLAITTCLVNFTALQRGYVAIRIYRGRD